MHGIGGHHGQFTVFHTCRHHAQKGLTLTVIRPDINRYKHKAFTNPPKDSLPSACGARLWQPFSPPDGGDQRLPRGPDQLPVLAGLTVSIINPRCIPHFARNANMRSKAGKVDARFWADMPTAMRQDCADDVVCLWTVKRAGMRAIRAAANGNQHLLLYCRFYG